MTIFIFRAVLAAFMPIYSLSLFSLTVLGFFLWTDEMAFSDYICGSVITHSCLSVGPLAKSPPDLLSAPSSSADLPSSIERVKHFKLLGINISHDFSWRTHTKAATRLFF